tara:strand:- start:230 stop:457 length:228 start_codon:yes stop_codon:yes gene_type:complete
MTQKTITQDEHSVLSDYYKNLMVKKDKELDLLLIEKDKEIKELKNDIFNLELQNTANNGYIMTVEEKLLKNNILL